MGSYSARSPRILDGVAHLDLTGLRDVGADHQSEGVIEPIRLGPLGQRFAAFLHEPLAEPFQFFAGVGIPRRDHTALIRVHSRKANVTDREVNDLAVIRKQVILPESGDALDFEVRAKTPTDVFRSEVEPRGDRLDRRGVDDRGPAETGVVGQSGFVADHPDWVAELLGEAVRDGFALDRESELAGLVRGCREPDPVGSVVIRSQPVDCGGALAVYVLALAIADRVASVARDRSPGVITARRGSKASSDLIGKTESRASRGFMPGAGNGRSSSSSNPVPVSLSR